MSKKKSITGKKGFYAKIPTGKKTTEWVHVLEPFHNGNSKGVGLKTGKTFEFCPCDIIKFWEGNLDDLAGLGMAYIPAAEVCNILDTVVPDSMGYETHIAARIVELKVGKPLNEYVAEKLHYTELEICKALSAEQVDAVALAIYNIEKKKQGMIIGDQTGIGKGRTAAAMIRYAHYNNLNPIFISEKPNLFSDIYRDLVDIGSGHLKPFIVNGKEAKTDIKDNEGEVVYSAPEKNAQEKIFNSQKFPAGFDFVCATYSQFSSAKKPTKPNFLRAIAQGAMIIMDEAHNASGTSQTGEFLQEVILGAKGVVFLSATFAKRPDNMPIYALKTAISEANMTKEDLVEAITKGGVALQEILAAQLVSEGQMIRRERSFEGVEVNYITLTEKEAEHKAIFDNITSVLRDIIHFQEDHVTKVVKQLDKIAAAEGKEVEERKGTSKAGVDNSPYFSKVFQVINQILFSLKARSVAELAIERLEEGKKPIIAFSSTMESFLDEMEVGDTIDTDFKEVLQRGLDGVLKYTVTDINGNREHKFFSPAELDPDAQADYFAILDKINKISTGISISPIDVIKQTIRAAGYSCDEVTGRKYEVQILEGKNAGVLINRKKILANDAFRLFNNNELDCLMINQSGSTGASAHAIVTPKVPKEQVKQRVMIILQAELDINREVQKRGRINRTGQILKPIYDYVSSAIPAERRLMMMLRKKLKSLDANTTSNQKQSENLLNVDDFLNKYGDKVVTEYLFENAELNTELGDPLQIEKSTEVSKVENAASKVSGRVAVLSIEDQEKFYEEILERYIDLVTYLKQAGQYDLEVEAMNLEAETIEKRTVIEGKQGSSVFSENTFLETCEVNVLKKPFTKEELNNIIEKNLNGQNPLEQQQGIIDDMEAFYTDRLKNDIENANLKYDKLIRDIPNEKNYQKANDKTSYIQQRTRELETARDEFIAKESDSNSNKVSYINDFLKYFYVGKALKYPLIGNDNAIAMCVGIHVDKKKNNPYAPSAMKIKIAIANSEKYIDLSLSGDPAKKLREIMGVSYSVGYDMERLIDRWEDFTKSANVNRKSSYIVTGNILQAFSKFDNGKLISFTTKDGSIRKGILLPENYDPGQRNERDRITVPIAKTVKYVQDMSSGDFVVTPDGKFILNYYNGYNDKDYYISVPANKNFQHIFKDTILMGMSLNPRDGFERRSDRMVAFFKKSSIPEVLSHLEKIHSLSVIIPRNVYEQYIDQKQPVKVKSDLIEKAEQEYEKDKQNFETRKAQQQKAEMKPAEIRSDLSLIKLKMKMKATAIKMRNSKNK
ncbi:MAG: strawberry notch family protein [Bacteroidales bacterium]|nr:strawberry notch family protein [Bacteroidales bacterium]